MARLRGVLGPRLHSVDLHPPRTCLDWVESTAVLKTGLMQVGLASSNTVDSCATNWLCLSYLLRVA